MRKIILSAAAGFVLLAAGNAFAAGGAAVPPAKDWTFQGIFGKFDRDQLKRGYQVYKDICAGCHSLRLVAYRNLMDIGFTEDEVKDIASEYQLPAPPNDDGDTIVDGERLMRAAKPSDHFVSPFANEKAARVANAGAYPPDLSLMVKARKKGPDYIYALLTGYKEEAPEGFALNEGMYYNEYFPGHQIAMAPPLMDESVEYEDGTPATLDQHAKDIVTFLAWTASPELEARKSMGIKVLLFLVVLTAMFYALKRRIWSDVH
ncbi:MAG: cytochrome c1 [Rhodospirillales bacterium]|nr:cytochrome c1 [Rhodospirillales bacterium]MCW8862130.1 cytochrome c1 [Rhodospirillales bacterium]MCW8952327.1 cytochrome c1 [Rhodospirillales bacterium]MCW8971182.1 cytochrome c1 [Rhodospirillales bacterium]MCW9002063.1 cytochrome c1 [Rhodospirillales bacterium]